jgi:FAD-dependent urate hydroxylase
MTSKRTALVIGGGIAGPVAATALQEAGIDPVVYKAYIHSAEGVGAFLGLGLNGIDALRAVDMDAPVVARGFATPRMIIANRNGKVLADFPNGGTLPDGTHAITITRADLHAALREEVLRRGRVRHRHRRGHGHLPCTAPPSGSAPHAKAEAERWACPPRQLQLAASYIDLKK